MGRGADRLTSVRRELAVARWLVDQGYPAAHLVTDAEQPIVIEDQPVTFGEVLADGDTYASTAEMGVLLRRLHDLEPPPFHCRDSSRLTRSRAAWRVLPSRRAFVHFIARWREI
nr:hypothetical protein [Streptomyces sp. NBC_01716]